jgi:hypothetical protein
MAAPQRFELPPLPYGMDALEPHTSGRTLSFHHDKHHAAYVANLNKALEQGDATQRYAGKSLDEVVKESYKAEDGSGPVFNNAGQARCDASEGVARVASWARATRRHCIAMHRAQLRSLTSGRCWLTRRARAPPRCAAALEPQARAHAWRSVCTASPALSLHCRFASTNRLS